MGYQRPGVVYLTKRKSSNRSNAMSIISCPKPAGDLITGCHYICEFVTLWAQSHKIKELICLGTAHGLSVDKHSQPLTLRFQARKPLGEQTVSHTCLRSLGMRPANPFSPCGHRWQIIVNWLWCCIQPRHVSHMTEILSGMRQGQLIISIPWKNDACHQHQVP